MTVRIRAGASHADGDPGQRHIGLLAQSIDGGEMLRQSVVVHEAQVGRAKFRAKGRLSAARREKGDGAGASTLHSQVRGRANKLILLQCFTF